MLVCTTSKKFPNQILLNFTEVWVVSQGRIEYIRWQIKKLLGLPTCIIAKWPHNISKSSNKFATSFSARQGRIEQYLCIYAYLYTKYPPEVLNEFWYHYVRNWAMTFSMHIEIFFNQNLNKLRLSIHYDFSMFLLLESLELQTSLFCRIHFSGS